MPTNKGKRIIILHAGSEDGFIPGCLLTAAKDIVNSAADYHQDMNSGLFETWVRTQLLPSLARRYPGKSCVVIMDNASYHTRVRLVFQYPLFVVSCFFLFFCLFFYPSHFKLAISQIRAAVVV